MTPSIVQTLNLFANLLRNWTYIPILTLLPNFGGFHGTLQRVRLANRGRFLLRTPGPVPFGTCICSNVETILSWTCHVYGPFEFRTSLGTSILPFNYKLINNLLCCNLSLNRCKIRPTKHCDYCKHDVENMRHLILDCENVMEIWYKTSTILDFVIQWKHIILGFFYESNNKITFLMNWYLLLHLKYISIKWRYNKTIEDKTGLLLYVKNSLLDFIFYVKVSSINIERFIPIVKKIIQIL